MGSKKKTDKVEPEEKIVGNEEVENTEDTKVEVNIEETPEEEKIQPKSRKAEDLKKEEAAKAYKKVDKETKSSRKKEENVDLKTEVIEESEEKIITEEKPDEKKAE